MERFEAKLVPGGEAPYTSWTFLVLPPEVVRALGRPPLDVRGTLAGVAFRGRAATGDGVVRMPVPRELRETAGVAAGDRVKVAIELDPDERTVEVPEELAAALADDPGAADLFAELPPAHRRAWAQHVAEAKRPETRERRAAKALDGIRARLFPGQ